MTLTSVLLTHAHTGVGGSVVFPFFFLSRVSFSGSALEFLYFFISLWLAMATTTLFLLNSCKINGGIIVFVSAKVKARVYTELIPKSVVKRHSKSIHIYSSVGL